jgi:proline dehydrogenase
VLRRVLLAASASSRLRHLATTTPAARAIVEGYVAGETADDAVRVTRALRAAGLLVSLDYLGEDTTDPAQAAAVAEEYVQLLGKLAADGLTDGQGAGAAEVSVKPTAVGLFLGGRTAERNIARICAAAAEAGTTVTLDAEEYAAIEPTLQIAAKLRGQFGDLGCVVQSCLRRAEADCRSLAGYGIRVRLCKGAYREPASVAYTARRDVDRSYARCLRVLMNGPGYPMIATHDPRLIQIAGSLALLTGRAAGSFEYQMLYGVRPGEQRRLANAGARVRVYVPYGGDWYAYLVRRLAERPANLAFFLRSLRGGQWGASRRAAPREAS